MATKAIAFIGLVFGGFYLVGNLLRIVEGIMMGRSILDAVVAALIGLLVGGVSCLAFVPKTEGDERDPFGKARFENDRSAAAKAGLTGD